MDLGKGRKEEEQRGEVRCSVGARALVFGILNPEELEVALRSGLRLLPEQWLTTPAPSSVLPGSAFGMIQLVLNGWKSGLLCSFFFYC